MKYSKEVEQAIKDSKNFALEINSKSIRPEHLFFALIKDEGSYAYRLLRDMNLNIDAIKKTLQDWSIHLQHQLGSFKPNGNFTIPLDLETEKIIKYSENFATKINSNEVNTEHVFYSILENNNNIVTELFSKSKETFKILKSRLSNKEEDNNYDMEDDTLKEKGSNKSLIAQFGTDLTKLAKEGALDPVVGRKNEIKRISQILSRRKKNNPVLVGEPGCVDADTIIIIRKISEDCVHEIIEINY